MEKNNKFGDNLFVLPHMLTGSGLVGSDRLVITDRQRAVERIIGEAGERGNHDLFMSQLHISLVPSLMNRIEPADIMDMDFAGFLNWAPFTDLSIPLTLSKLFPDQDSLMAALFEQCREKTIEEAKVDLAIAISDSGLDEEEFLVETFLNDFDGIRQVDFGFFKNFNFLKAGAFSRGLRGSVYIQNDILQKAFFKLNGEIKKRLQSDISREFEKRFPGNDEEKCGLLIDYFESDTDLSWEDVVLKPNKIREHVVVFPDFKYDLPLDAAMPRLLNDIFFIRLKKRFLLKAIDKKFEKDSFNGIAKTIINDLKASGSLISDSFDLTVIENWNAVRLLDNKIAEKTKFQLRLLFNFRDLAEIFKAANVYYSRQSDQYVPAQIDPQKLISFENLPALSEADSLNELREIAPDEDLSRPVLNGSYNDGGKTPPHNMPPEIVRSGENVGRDRLDPSSIFQELEQVFSNTTLEVPAISLQQIMETSSWDIAFRTDAQVRDLESNSRLNDLSTELGVEVVVVGETVDRADVQPLHDANNLCDAISRDLPQALAGAEIISEVQVAEVEVGISNDGKSNNFSDGYCERKSASGLWGKIRTLGLAVVVALTSLTPQGMRVDNSSKADDMGKKVAANGNSRPGPRNNLPINKAEITVKKNDRFVERKKVTAASSTAGISSGSVTVPIMRAIAAKKAAVLNVLRNNSEEGKFSKRAKMDWEKKYEYVSSGDYLKNLDAAGRAAKPYVKALVEKAELTMFARSEGWLFAYGATLRSALAGRSDLKKQVMKKFWRLVNSFNKAKNGDRTLRKQYMGFLSASGIRNGHELKLGEKIILPVNSQEKNVFLGELNDIQNILARVQIAAVQPVKIERIQEMNVSANIGEADQLLAINNTKRASLFRVNNENGGNGQSKDNNDRHNVGDLLKNDEIQGNKEPLHEAYAAIRRESGNDVDTGGRVFQQVSSLGNFELERSLRDENRRENSGADGDLDKAISRMDAVMDEYLGSLSEDKRSNESSLTGYNPLDLLSGKDELDMALDDYEKALPSYVAGLNFSENEEAEFADNVSPLKLLDDNSVIDKFISRQIVMAEKANNMAKESLKLLYVELGVGGFCLDNDGMVKFKDDEGEKLAMRAYTLAANDLEAKNRLEFDIKQFISQQKNYV